MARADIAGLFWDDTPPPKPPKLEKPKRTPPEPVWLLPSYLPGLEEARKMRPILFTDEELIEASRRRERLVYDIECYPNYFLIAFRSLDSRKCLLFELDNQPCGLSFSQSKLHWVLTNFTLVGFNIHKYDNIICALAVAGFTTEQLHMVTEDIITYGTRPQDVYKKAKVSKLKIDSIDLIEYTALRPSLKICAGRMHAPRMQDLPFVPGSILTEEQIIITRWYCVNDLDNTELLYRRYADRLALREKLSIKYAVDLRSSSDAQMAESIISTEVKRLTGQKFLNRTKLPPGTSYKFQTPHFIRFQTDLLNYVLNIIQTSEFKVSDEDGTVVIPPEVKGLVIEILQSKYKIGIGGLHSREKSVGYVADDEYELVDIDATSYYPFLILNAGITPQNLGNTFLIVYNGLVISRVAAKEAGDVTMAEGLKITVNGTFGKLGSPWSVVYAPNLMLQTTITGQLCLLMYIERMELAGFSVISANTDGIVTRVKRSRKAEFDAIVRQWEIDTGLKTEETKYKAVYSRDVNNYIAIYETPQKGKLFKGKGIFNAQHEAKSADASSVDLKKNPTNEIFVHAAIELILYGTPIEKTIRECKDITKFTSMRYVRGGGVKDGIYLGKVIRWYHATGVEGEIIYARSGNKVPDTEGSKPLMQLPAEFPSDIDYDWYERETRQALVNMGYTVGEVTESPDEDVNDEPTME